MAQNGFNGYEQLAPSQKLLVWLYIAVAVWYLSWRTGTFNNDALVFSLLLYAAEVYGAVTAALHVFMVWRLRRRTPPSSPEGISVDVFVPTYDEPIELVRRSLLAVQHMAYPHQTWLLDDGCRPEMKELADEMSCRYLARTGRDNAKAGNLNNALQHSVAEFIAIFDADHAPKREFLLRTLGFFRDPLVAFVQTPQDFYNLDSYQHRVKWNTRGMFTEQSLFFRVIQRGKDYWNAAFFCGSCAVLRRSSLDTVGGFATGTVTEDLHTSVRLHKQGYRSVYYPESLAFGLAPVSVRAFLMQRIRWGNGAIQVWRRERLLTSGNLTLAQKLNYVASVLTYFDGWQKLIFYLVPALVLYSGVLPISALGWPFLLHLTPYYLLTYLVFEEVGRGYGHSIYIEQYNMARFAAFVRSTLGVFRVEQQFKVTPKRTGNERVVPFVVPQYMILLLNATAIAFALTATYMENGRLTVMAVAFNVFWAGINLWLSLAVMLFTLRRPRRRRDYRFPLLLPATLMLHRDPAQIVYALVRDLSPEGLRLSVSGKRITNDDCKVTGRVYLPGGTARFDGTIRNVKADDASAQTLFGCVVNWDGPDDVRRIETFLYGSDLQWRFHDLHEAALTPLQRMRIVPAPNAGSIYSDQEWRPVLAIVQVNEGRPRQLIGAATVIGRQGRQRLLLFEEVQPQAALEVYQPSGDDGSWHRCSVVRVEHIDTPLAPIYLCDVVSAEEQSYATDKQQGGDGAVGHAYLGTGARDVPVVVGR